MESPSVPFTRRIRDDISNTSIPYDCCLIRLGLMKLVIDKAQQRADWNNHLVCFRRQLNGFCDPCSIRLCSYHWKAQRMKCAMSLYSQPFRYIASLTYLLTSARCHYDFPCARTLCDTCENRTHRYPRPPTVVAYQRYWHRGEHILQEWYEFNTVYVIVSQKQTYPHYRAQSNRDSLRQRAYEGPPRYAQCRLRGG